MLNQFEIIDKLGEGSYSSVFKVKRKATNTIYAMKKVNIPFLSEKEQQNALNEVRIIASVKHQNIIAYKESFFDTKHKILYVIMEHADGGDLLQKLREHREHKSYIDEATIWNIFIQIVQALKALHDNNIVHRDLKSANILLCNDGRVKLADFNVSKIVMDNMTKTQIGTPFYASPEIWNNIPYDYQADMWSLGCIVYEMCCLKTPFQGQDMQQICKKVCKGQYLKIPNIYSLDLAYLIKTMLQLSPEKRPNCDKLLEHQFIQNHINHSINQTFLFTSSDHSYFELLSTINWTKNIQKGNDMTQTTIRKISKEDQKQPQKKRVVDQVLDLDFKDDKFFVSLPPSHYSPNSNQKRRRGEYDTIPENFDVKYREKLYSIQTEPYKMKPKTLRSVINRKPRVFSQQPISQIVQDVESPKSVDRNYQAPYNHYIEDSLIQDEVQLNINKQNNNCAKSKLKLQLRTLNKLPFITVILFKQKKSNRKLQVITETSQSKRVKTFSVQNSQETPSLNIERRQQKIYNEYLIAQSEQNLISRNSLGKISEQLIVRRDQVQQSRSLNQVLPRSLHRLSVNEQSLDSSQKRTKQKIYSSFDRQKDM